MRHGKGIALSIKRDFPEAYAADFATPKGDRAKLGTLSSAEIHRVPARFNVVNAYTQFHWRGEGVFADYDAIRSTFKRIKQQFAGQRIGYPARRLFPRKSQSHAKEHQRAAERALQPG